MVSARGSPASIDARIAELGTKIFLATIMLESTRVFIGIAVSEPIERELAQLQAELAPAVPGCRWTSTLPFHLTLAFLGDVPNKDLDKIYQVTSESAESIDPFVIDVTGVGAFPSSRRPRVIWAGVTAPNLKLLFDLQASLAKSLARVGHRPNDDRFHPHVTLGRIKRERPGPGDLTGLIERHQAWSSGPCPVTEVQVFASTLAPSGSVYTVLSRGALCAKKTESRP
jgi:RNA 2',3'-cyclic 3'-phosphodiesterase